MAQQSVRNQTETVPVAPRSARVPKGKTATWDYSRWRLTLSDPDQFMDFMRGYPAPEGVTIFLYRLIPRIDLSLIGQRESNIQKGGYADLSLFSLEAVADKFKNGKYYLKVTDSNRPDNQREVVKSCTFKIQDAGPPVYDIRTLELGHSDNIDEVNRQITAGVLLRDANGVPRIRTQADAMAPAAPAVVVAAPADPLASGSLVAQIVMAALGKVSQSPSEAVKDTIAMAQLLHPPAAPVENVEAVVRRVMAEGRGPAGGDLAAYERVEGFITKVRGVAGIAGATGTAAPAGTLTDGFAASNPAAWMPHIGPAVRELRGLVTDLFSFTRSTRSTAPPAANNQTGAPAADSAPAAIEGGRPPATMREAIEDVAQRGLQMMSEGVRGFDYAAYICGMYHPPIGLQVFRQLEQFGGVVGLVSMMAMNPLTRAMVNDPAQRAQIETFLSDFFSFEPEPSPEDSADESVTAAPAGANGSAAAMSA